MCINKISPEVLDEIREEYFGYSCSELQAELDSLFSVEPHDEIRCYILNELLHETVDHEVFEED